jgi:tetratricopeptide (TPR) repeat protein
MESGKRGEFDVRTWARRLLVMWVVCLLPALALLVSACSSDVDKARKLENEGDIGGAIAIYQAVLKDDSGNVAALSALGSDLMIQGRFDEALPIQEETVKLDSKDVQTRVELGFNYLNHQNRPSDAVRVLKEAAALDGSAKNLTFLAQAQAAAADTAGEEASLRQAIAKDPKYPHAYTLLRDLLVSLGRTQDAAQVGDMARQQGVTPDSSQ